MGIKEKIGTSLILFSAIIVFTLLFLMAPISQDPAYHHFSDTAALLAIPNLLNVISNLPFLLVGILGLTQLSRSNLYITNSNKYAYITLFLGALLVSFGSSYYHLMPNNQTLLWDRLPMTIAFMALFSLILSEFISEKLGRYSLLPLLILGLSSVAYWYLTELDGQGDLRFYAAIQFFPLLAISIILLCFKSCYTKVSAYWWLLMTYLSAKLFEHFDVLIHNSLIVISGHSIKHIAAALGLYILYKAFRNREFIPD